MKTDVHSFSNPEEVSVSHLHLDLDLNFNKKIMSGSCELTLENHKGTTKIVLDTRDLDIKKVTKEDGSEINWKLGKEEPFLGSPLQVDIDKQTKKIKIFYETSPDAAAVQWVEVKGRAPFLFTQSQAILARSWIPCQDGPGVKFTYSAQIKVPQGLMALMSAENETTKSADGVYRFNMPQPISSYLLALTVGDFEFKPLGKNCGVYAEPDMLEKAEAEFKDIEQMIEAAEKLYGPYRWGRYDVIVLPASFPFGGMENPRLTFATPTIISGDRSLVSLIAHELAHSWSGNLVTNATWNDFWLNEGFTVYFESRIMESLYGKDYADMLEYLGFYELKHTVKEFGEKSASTHLLLDMKGMDPDDAVNDIAYEKGRFFLRTIEEAVGRRKWDEFVQKYFNEFAFKSMTTEGFLSYLDKELIKGDEALKQQINYEAWVFGPGIPANVPPVKARLFEEVDEAVKSVNEPEKIKESTKNWNTHQWLHFLRNLPENLSADQMNRLDKSFHFTESGNCEILCDWFQHCIDSRYQPSYVRMEKFLTSVGRRKFIVPLYKKLLAYSEGRKMAEEIFAKAKSGYHPLTRQTIQDLIQEKK